MVNDTITSKRNANQRHAREKLFYINCKIILEDDVVGFGHKEMLQLPEGDFEDENVSPT